MADKEEYIGKSEIKGKPKRPLDFKLKEKAVKEKHLDDSAVTTPKIADRNVTPEKLSEDVQDAIVTPITSEIDERYRTITDELDGKYSSITDELYSMIESLQVGGIALSQKFGYRTDIGISQKTLTKALGRLWDELGELTGKTYMDFTLTVTPTQIFTEGVGTVTVTADCSGSISDFDSVKIYVNNELVAESGNITKYIKQVSVSQSSTIKVVGVILGRTITKQASVFKEIPFFMGSGQNYTDVMNFNCLKTLEGTLEGDYDVTVSHDNDYMFIIIPISHKDEFRRADMNGLGLKVEIPLNATEFTDFVVYKSVNTYKTGTYNVDIDINS